MYKDGEIKLCLNETELNKNEQLRILNENPELKKAHNILESLLSILKPLEIYYNDYWDIAVNLKRKYDKLNVDSTICKMFEWFDNYHITNYNKQLPYELSFLNLLMHLNCYSFTQKEYIFFTYDLFALFIERLENQIKYKSKKPFLAKKLCKDYIIQLDYAKKIYNYGITDVLKKDEVQNTTESKKDSNIHKLTSVEDVYKQYLTTIDVSRLLYENTINIFSEAFQQNSNYRAIKNISSFEFIAFFIAISKTFCTDSISDEVEYQCNKYLLRDTPDDVKEFFNLRVDSYEDISNNIFSPVGFRYLNDSTDVKLTQYSLCNKYLLYLYDCLYYAAMHEDAMLFDFNGKNVITDFTKSLQFETTIIKSFINNFSNIVTNLIMSTES